MSFLGSFEHTTGKTWRGTQISPFALQASSILGGFFGLDHILLRSPKTALMKLIVNIFTLGFWYWYDVVQSISDMDFIKQFGYTIPIVGPVGLGAGIVGDEGRAPEGTPSPWLFVAYILLLFIPYGTSSFIAGDFYGGTAKFLLTFIIFTTFLGLLWAGYSFYYAFFQTESLLTKGTDRFFPATIFMDPYGPAKNLIPPKLTEAENLLQGEQGLFDWLCSFLVNKVEKPILETAVAAAEPVVEGAEVIKNLAEPAVKAVNQVGGAVLPDTTSKYLFLATTTLIFLGSVTLTYFRFWRAKKNDPSEHRKKNDIPPERFENDTPPGPRVL